MLTEQVLSYPPRVLTQSQREFYFANGYVFVEKLISEEWIDRLQAVTAEFVEKSREVTETGLLFDVAPGHTAERPRLRRLQTPDQQHPTYWEFATGTIANVAADLVGPNVTFHHSKLNFKWHDGGDSVRWHQDITFYPHTNFSPLVIGTYFTDVEMAHGPFAAVARSHEEPLYDQYDEQGNWAGCLSDADAASLDPRRFVHFTGPAGSIAVVNSRTIHGSPPSEVDEPRPLLLNAYASADALPYTKLDPPGESIHYRDLVRGEPARWAHHDPRPCLIPPEWTGENTSIFAAQTGEHKARRGTA